MEALAKTRKTIEKRFDLSRIVTLSTAERPYANVVENAHLGEYLTACGNKLQTIPRDLIREHPLDRLGTKGDLAENVLQQAAKCPHRCRRARSIGAEQGHHLPCPNLDANPLEIADWTIACVEVSERQISLT